MTIKLRGEREETERDGNDLRRAAELKKGVAVAARVCLYLGEMLRPALGFERTEIVVAAAAVMHEAIGVLKFSSDCVRLLTHSLTPCNISAKPCIHNHHILTRFSFYFFNKNKLNDFFSLDEMIHCWLNLVFYIFQFSKLFEKNLINELIRKNYYMEIPDINLI